MPPAELDRQLLLLTIQIGVIIAAARLLGLAFRRWQQPQVIGEVVAGLLLGPSLLGWLAPGLSAELFPVASLPFLKLLSEIGIVFFMFLIGLELSPTLLRQRGRAAAVISTASIVLPFALGAAAALALFETQAGPGVSRASFAVFLGAAMAITAFPVLARILIERDLLRTPLGTLALTCAAVDDIAGWCLLSLVAALGTAGSGGGAVALGWLLLYAGAMVFVARPLLGRLRTVQASAGGVSQNLLAVIFLLLLASALATQWIGIHAIFGGFVLGAVMPKQTGFVRDVADKVEDFTTVFFLPIYFAHVGLRTQVGLLDSPALWGWCLVLIAIAVAGKFGGSVVAARAMRIDWRDALGLGVLLNTRGLMELIILNVGLDLGLITPALFAMMVLMAIVTTVMAAPALSLIDRRWGVAPARAAPPAGGGVLVPVALPASGPRLLDLALALAPGEAARIYALHVSRPAERGALGANLPEAADGALDPLLARARERGVAAQPLWVTSRTPADAIVETAALHDAQLIVMGWHQPVFRQSVLGGTLDRVLRRSPADVAVLIDKGLPETLQRILLPYAGTRHDRLALRLATQLARRAGADLTLLHVVRRDGTGRRLPGAARQLLDTEVPEPLTGHQTRVLVIESDRPVDAVLAEAARCDLTVLGVGDEWEIGQQLFGLRSERVAVDNPTSLLIVRAAAGD